VQPFEHVKAGIEKKLIETRASQLAAQEGRQQLEQLRQGKDAQVQWSAPQLVSRRESQGFAEPLVKEVFKADASKLPAYSGVEAPGGGGYVLLRIMRVVEPAKLDRAQQNSLGEALAQMQGEEHFTAYLESLKQKTKVKINKEAIERKQQ
jgi:peptidyl-prolyl cis-trans isomerase D